MAKTNIFEGIDELRQSNVLGGFECFNCGVTINKDPTVQPYMAVHLASEKYPDWVFYENAQFCSQKCDSEYN